MTNLEVIKILNTILKTGEQTGWMYFIRNRNGLQKKKGKTGFDRYLKMLKVRVLVGYGVRAEKGIYTFMMDEGRVFMIHTLPESGEAKNACDMTQWEAGE